MRQPSLLQLTMATLLLAFLSTGCTTTPNSYPPGSAVSTGSSNSATLQSVREDLINAQVQTRETRAALERLVTAHREEVREVFRDFSEGVEKVTDAGERLVRHAEGIREQGSAYLVEEEKSTTECQYPRLSEHGGTTSIELGDLLEPISRQTGVMERSYLEFRSDIEQIRDAVGRHTTRNGIDAIEFFIEKAQVTGESLDQAIEKALAAVQEAQQEQEQAEPEPEPEPPPAPVP